MRARLDPNGKLTKRPDSPSAAEARSGSSANLRQVTPDGYSVNTSQPPFQPSGIPPSAEGDPNLADLRVRLAWVRLCRRRRQNHRRYALRKGGELGLVCRRGIKRSRRPPTAARKAQDHLRARRQQPQLPAHHQPFNYLCGLRPAPRTVRRTSRMASFVQAIDSRTLPQWRSTSRRDG